jgi:hypothetical protein
MNSSRDDGASSQESLTAMQAAMSVADIIRKYVLQSEQEGLIVNENLAKQSRENTSDSWISVPDFITRTPGLLEGITAGLVSLGVLTPVRRVFLGAVGRSFGDLPEIFITVSQVILSADVGFLTCSVLGSRHYLHSLASVSSSAPSPTADQICNHKLVQELSARPNFIDPSRTMDPSSKPSSVAQWDPRLVLAIDLQEALRTCRDRQTHQSSLLLSPSIRNFP